MSTYEQRQAIRDQAAKEGRSVVVDANSVYDNKSQKETPIASYTGGGGSSGGGGSAPAPAPSAGAASGGLQQLLDALASGNAAAAAEATRQFNTTFGLDQQKFTESVRQYNQNFGLAQAGVSGVMADGSPTEAAKEAANKIGIDLLTLGASLHSDPFRQMETMYGAKNMPGVNRAVQGLTGQYGLPGAFTAPGGPNTANLYGLMSQYNGATSGVQAAQATGMTNPNQIIAREYNNAPQNVQNYATSALSMNTGLDQSEVDKQIQRNLPKFNAPSFGLASV